MGDAAVIALAIVLDRDLPVALLIDRDPFDRLQAVELGQLWKVDSDERFGQSQVLNDVYALLGEFKRADATIHSIDIGRLTGEPGTAARGRQDGLFILSSETGGEFYRNFNDLSQAMGKMLERTSVTYVLAFQPSDLRPGDVDAGYRHDRRDGHTPSRILDR